jgi:hypothetical protein
MNDPINQAGGLWVYNNIWAFNRDGEASSPRRQLFTVGTSNMIWDYNQYYSDDGAVQIYYNRVDRTFGYWQRTVGQDVNGTKANPNFTDRASDDYTTTANLTGTKSDATLRAWHADADKGLGEDSNINPQQCGNTPGGFAQCAKGLVLVDRDNFNHGNWGKGAFVYESKGSAGDKKKLQVYNLRIKPRVP